VAINLVSPRCRIQVKIKRSDPRSWKGFRRSLLKNVGFFVFGIFRKKKNFGFKFQKPIYFFLKKNFRFNVTLRKKVFSGENFCWYFRSCQIWVFKIWRATFFLYDLVCIEFLNVLILTGLFCSTELTSARWVWST